MLASRRRLLTVRGGLRLLVCWRVASCWGEGSEVRAVFATSLSADSTHPTALQISTHAELCLRFAANEEPGAKAE